jgi:uncharacterized phage protein (TIGR01671 family)
MIRFRAWNKATKEMYEVDDIMSIDFGKSEISVKTLFFERTNCYKFDDIELMQSTGLTDKNGKEIFEGDILSIETDEENVKVKLEVSWDSKHALFVFDSKKYNAKEALGELFEDNPYPFKIIGNVWEDPELAEVSS